MAEPITSTTVVAGGQSQPVKLTLQPSGKDAPPMAISWEISDPNVTAVEDESGFRFAAAAEMAPATVSATPTYRGPRAAQPLVGPAFSVEVQEPETGLQVEAG